MFALIRNLLLARETTAPGQNQSQDQSRLAACSQSMTAGIVLLTVSSLWSTAAQAQTIFPDGPSLSFQTSGVRRCANIGDWYTTGGIGADPNGQNEDGTCGPTFGGGAATTGAPGFHSISINVTQVDLDNAGGNLVITILDAESAGDDPGNGIIDESFDDPDPTEFRLLAPGGAIIETRIFDGEPNGTNFAFQPITAPGVYEIQSRTGDFYINGPFADSLERNNDDNSFAIQAPVDALLIGQLNGSFQQDSTGNIDLDLFFLVGPGTEELFLRNFDLEFNPANPANNVITYTDPGGTVIPGTNSGNGTWNGGLNDLDDGGDNLTIDPVDDAGRWTIDITNYTVDNQTVIEVEGAPVFETPPTRAGNFTITPDTTLSTVIGTEVCHPFRVTNNFFTTDIVNFELSGTDPNYTVELRADDETTPLTDTDGDGAVDTGILQVEETVNFFLCVTPEDGAPPQDVTTISGTSFLDVVVREQAVADGIPGADPNPDIQSVIKTTLIPEIGLAKDISTARAVDGQPDVYEYDVTYVVTNTGEEPLNDVQVTDDLQEVLIDNPTVDGADGFTIESIVVDDFTGTAANAPTANPDYDGDTNQNLFTDDANTFESGDIATVILTVQVDLSTDGILDTENSATATGTDSAGNSVSDVSQNGSDVDPDDDGDPTNNNDPTPWQFGAPQIGLAKAISTPIAVPNQPGFFDFDMTFIVVNTGDVGLNNVQVTDDLQTVLIDNPTTNGADGYSVEAITVDSFSGVAANAPTANPAYDGNTDQNLFTDDANAFDVGDTATVTVSVRVDLSSDGILDTENTALATGTDANGIEVSDISQNGRDVDPDNNGDPGDNSDPPPITIDSEGSLVIIKRITNIFRQGIALTVQGIGSFNDQASDDNDNDLSDAFTTAGVANQPAGIVELPSDFELQPNDELEYTLFFWNDSSVELSQVQICDELQPPSVLNTNAGLALSPVGPLAEPSFGNAGGLVQGQSPGATLADFCISAPGIFPFGPPGPAGGLGVGAGGGVTAGAFTVPAGEFGAIRFRVRLP